MGSTLLRLKLDEEEEDIEDETEDCEDDKFLKLLRRRLLLFVDVVPLILDPPTLD